MLFAVSSTLTDLLSLLKAVVIDSMFFVALVSTADVVLMADGNPIRAMNLNCKHFIILFSVLNI